VTCTSERAAAREHEVRARRGDDDRLLEGGQAPVDDPVVGEHRVEQRDLLGRVVLDQVLEEQRAVEHEDAAGVGERVERDGRLRVGLVAVVGDLVHPGDRASRP
jgi:hypothetical protein